MDADLGSLYEAAREGKREIGVDKARARRLWTGLSVAQLRDMLGMSVYIEKLTVMFFFAASFLLMPVSALFTVIEFRAWSLAILPVQLSLYIVYFSRASLPDRPAYRPAILALLGFIGWLALRVRHPQMANVILAFPLPFLSARLLYSLSATFVRMAAVRSPRAFEALLKDVIVAR